ncbi:MAG TPA: single-stranded-DNA-specific exonuclease RecJ [Candidatus Saccharimonadales bacterium]|nr:single-stranded-DNA-specific exonuclease RecJ [Candidatus Saccharimonadales bacterium]
MANWQVLKRTNPDLFKHLLELRGFREEELEPKYEDLLDPFLLPDMDKAVEIIKQIKEEKKEAVVFGDYDADGTPGAAVLGIMLEQLGIPCQIIIPTRAEGYGIKPEVVEKFGAQVGLLILVDTGIRANAEVKAAHKKSIKVIILDHHLPVGDLPKADALVDQHLKNSKYSFKGLCGCALAFKLVCALEKSDVGLNNNLSRWLLDLVAISTVSDMMPLTGENRILVSYGLKVLTKSRWPGVNALIRTAKIDTAKLSAYSLGFVLGPRLNATGRLGDNQPALDLLLTKDAAQAEELAWKIERINRERQELVEKLTALCQEELFKQNNSKDKFFLLKGKDWPMGVVGLVAGRIAGIFNRPTIVASESNGVIVGSGRSIPSFSLIDALSAQEKLMVKFGGHKAAAGLTVESKNWEKFAEGLKKYAEKQIDKKDLTPKIIGEAVLASEEITLEVATELEQLAPFGSGNPTPRLILENVEVTSVTPLGQKGDHLRMNGIITAENGMKTDLEMIGFGITKKFPKTLGHFDFLGTLEINRWNGRERLQYRIFEHRKVGDKIEEIEKAEEVEEALVD